METIELTNDQYKTLLSFKNLVSLKVQQVTNPDVLKLMETEKDMPDGINEALDYEPEYSFGECIEDVIGSVIEEQETGKVNYIT